MKTLKTLKHIALLVGILLMSLVGEGQQWVETDEIVPGEEYLIGLVDGNNVYLAVNYVVDQSSNPYYTSANGVNYYGYTAQAIIDTQGNITGVSGFASDLQYCTWKFSSTTGGTIQSGYENGYYLNTWSNTSYEDLYPNNSTSDGTNWVYSSRRLYRTVGSDNRYAEYFNVEGPHMRVTSTMPSEPNIKLYSKSTCPKPTNVQVAEQSENYLITWDGEAQSYTVYVYMVTKYENVTENELEVLLYPGENYYVRVESICGESANSSDFITSGTPLPIKLLSFTGTPHYSNFNKWEYNLIQWSTATETNNDYFVLESSADAVNFKEIAKVAGAGSSIEQLDYDFKDYHPVSDITYYRLTQVDYDGTRTSSEIISCEIVKEKFKHIYFTRYDNLLQVHSNDKVLTIICSDLLGRTIWQGKLLPHDDEELVLKVPYMVHIYEDGNLVGSEKMLK